MRTDDLYLVDVIESAALIADFLKGRTLESFTVDELTRSAVLWRLTVLTEAATKLSQKSRDSLREIPWEEIRGLRNRLIHGYFTLDWPLVWEIVTQAVPQLRLQAEKMLELESPDTYAKLLARRGGKTR